MNLRVVSAYELSKRDEKAINDLLKEAFDTYPVDQTYFKQIPNAHVLLEVDGQLISHASINYRLMSIGDQTYKVIGISDVCVANQSQGQGYGRKLLSKIEKMASSAGAKFLVLISNETKFYQKQGFEKIKARARWVFFGKDRLMGVHERNFSESLLVKSVSKEKWPKGTIDFLGPLF